MANPVADTAPVTPLSDAIFNRRSVRAYKGSRLDRAAIENLLIAAVHAPTAMHAEPWLFVIVQDPPRLRRYSEKVKQAWLAELEQHAATQPPGAHGPAAMIERVKTPSFDPFYNAGNLILICARMENPFVTADCWLAAENLMLAATERGLGTCCVGAALATLNTPEIKHDLALPADVTVIASIVVGEPTAAEPPSPRRAPVILAWR